MSFKSFIFDKSRENRSGGFLNWNKRQNSFRIKASIRSLPLIGQSGFKSFDLRQELLPEVCLARPHTNNWAASCEKGPDDIFCPFLVLSFFAHFIPEIT